MQKDTAKTEKNRAAQAEDLALKSAAAFFGEELIGWLGVRKKVLRAVPTELVELEARHMYKEEIAMTKLGQMIWDDAMERGIEQGIVQGRREGERIGQERYSHLILILSREQRMDPDQIVKIASDPEYREALYQQYGI